MVGCLQITRHLNFTSPARKRVAMKRAAARKEPVDLLINVRPLLDHMQGAVLRHLVPGRDLCCDELGVACVVRMPSEVGFPSASHLVLELLAC